jgi:hypothetical protein
MFLIGRVFETTREAYSELFKVNWKNLGKKKERNF